MTTIETTAAPPAPIQYIPLGQLHESKTNPRKTWGKLDDLVENVRKVGILQPLLARTNGGKTYELVFGHRRFRAAKAAGLESVPVMIRTMTDLEVLEAQVIENLHREDVHALEEAEGYERLHDTHGCSVDDIAAKVGKSRAYVYARMKLLALGPEGRAAFYDGTVSASVALYLARVPASMQVEALKLLAEEAGEVSGWYPEKEGDKPPTDITPLGARDASRLLRDRFMLTLATAPFDRGDATLVPAAGSCTDCPKRSGNQKDLFADVSTPDLCTDPTCFATKRTAAAAETIAKLEKKGTKVLEGKVKQYGRPAPPAGYAIASDYSTELGKPWDEVLKNKKIADKVPGTGRAVMLDERNKPVPLVKKSEVLAAAGYDAAKKKAGAERSADDWNSPASVMKRKAEELGDAAVTAQMVTKVEVSGLTDAFLRVLCGTLELYAVAERRGWPLPKQRWNADFSAQLAKVKGPELVGVLIEGLVREVRGDAMTELCKHFKLDLKAAVAKELEKLKAAAKSAAPAAAAPPAKKATPGKAKAKK